MKSTVFIFLLVIGVFLRQASEVRGSVSPSTDFCYEKLGTISLDFNPGFLSVIEFDDEHDAGDAGLALYITSFFNVALERGNWWWNLFFAWFLGPRRVHHERDLVARVPNIDQVIQDGTYETTASTSVEKLTDLVPETCWLFFPCPPKTDWPNDAIKVPDGVFPFAALLIPQGFLVDATLGRLTAINMKVDSHTEYIVDQSTWPFPRYYHEVVFYDVNQDGLLDIVAARAPFHPQFLSFVPHGELVFFENPGHDAILAGQPWNERIIYGFPNAGPDIALKAHDFDGDGVPEFLGTSLFHGDQIILLGAPCDNNGCSWSNADYLWNPPRAVTLSNDQGNPFGLVLEDLNGDGIMDLLATNHQRGLDCQADEDIAGRVYALEPPTDPSRLFEQGTWTSRILFDGIRPHVTPPGAAGCRLAPGAALPFYPGGAGSGDRPWIVLGGDEAAKVWVLKPTGDDETNWEYNSTVIFDINEYYGPDTTQTELVDREGVTVSTIGKVATLGSHIFVPVFEGHEIHVYNISSC